MCRANMLMPLSVYGDEIAPPAVVFKDALQYAAKIRSTDGCNMTNVRALTGLFDDAPDEVKHSILEETIRACATSDPPVPVTSYLMYALQHGSACEHVVNRALRELTRVGNLTSSDIETVASVMAEHPMHVSIQANGCHVIWAAAYSASGAIEVRLTFGKVNKTITDECM